MALMHVLVVEEDEDIRDLYTQFLDKERGLDVSLVGDATTALTFLATHPVDVLVTEWHLTDMSARDFIQYVQRHYPRLKIILVGAGHAVQEAAHSMGLDGCVLKPDISRLGALLRRLAPSRPTGSNA